MVHPLPSLLRRGHGEGDIVRNCSAPARAGRSAPGRAGSPPVPLRAADLHPVSALGSFQEGSACGIRNVFKLAVSVGVHLRRLPQTVVSDSLPLQRQLCLGCGRATVGPAALEGHRVVCPARLCARRLYFWETHAGSPVRPGVVQRVLKELAQLFPGRLCHLSAGSERPHFSASWMAPVGSPSSCPPTRQV